MDIVKWRESLRRKAYELAREAASKISGTVMLIGSYARGDFGVDSDIDLLVVADFKEPPHRRLLDFKPPPGVEIIAMTLQEVFRVVEKCYPVAADIAIGVVLKDDLGVADVLVAKARRCLKK